MARKLSPLTAALTLNINGWSAGLKQVERDRKALESSLRPLGDISKQFGTALTAAGLAVGGTLVALSKKAADFGDTLLDASKRTGVSTQALSAYKLLADQSGSSFETLSRGLGLLSKNIVAAGSGSKEQAKVFSALGIAVKDASGNIRNASDIMPEVAARFASMEDGALKSALAMKLFGKSGVELIPTLNEGAEGFKRAQEQTQKFGVALTRAEAELGDKFNDSLAESKAAMQGFANAVGVALLPKLTELVIKGNEWIATASKWVKAHPDLTSAIAKTSAGIVGAGGLLLGLSGLVTIVPKVYAGIQLLINGYKALGVAQAIQAAQLLKGVKSFKDFSAGLDLIGESSIAAKAGLVALAAAVGYTIGKFINGQIEAAGYQKQVDSLINTLAKYGALGPVAMIFAERGSAKAEADRSAEFTAKATAERLKKLGITFEEASARSKKLYEDGQKLKQGQKQQGDAASAAEIEYKKLMAALGGTGSATDKAKSQIDQMWQSLKGEGTEATSLETVLQRVYNMPQDFTTADVLDKLGSTIKDVAQEFVDAGKPMPALISYYNFLARNADALAESAATAAAENEALNKAIFEGQKMIDQSREDIRKAAYEPIEIIRPQNDVAAGTVEAVRRIGEQRREIEQLTQEIENLSRAGFNAEQIEQGLGVSLEEVSRQARELGIQMSRAAQETLDGAVASKRMGDAYKRLGDQADDIRQLSTEIAMLSRAGMSARQIETALGVSIEGVLKAAKDLGVELDPLKRKTMENALAAQKMRDSWGESVGGISDGLKDMVLNSDYSFRKLGDIGKSTFKSLASSALDGFFKPFKDGLTRLGEEAGSAFGNILFGANRTRQEAEGVFSGGGGLLGGLISNIGSGLAGLFGGGKGKEAGAGVFGSAIPGMDSIGKALAGPMEKMNGLAAKMNPVAMGASIANEAFDLVNKITGKIGAGRDSANEVIKSQEAFVGQTLKNILADPMLSATNKLKLVNNEWETFQQNLARFSAAGGEGGVTSNQAFATVSPLIAQIKTDLIKAGASIAGVTDQMDFTPFTSAVSEFADAVKRFASRTLPVAESADLPSLASGGLLKKTGLVFAHQGEVVMPLEDMRAKLSELKNAKGLMGAIASALDRKLALASPNTPDFTPAIESTAAQMAGLLARRPGSSDTGPSRPASKPGLFPMGDVTVHLAPVFHFAGKTDALTVRNEIVPEITVLLQTAGRGVRAEWTRIFNSETPPDNPATVGI